MGVWGEDVERGFLSRSPLGVGNDNGHSNWCSEGGLLVRPSTTQPSLYPSRDLTANTNAISVKEQFYMRGYRWKQQGGMRRFNSSYSFF